MEGYVKVLWMIGVIFEGITLIVSIISLRNYKHTALKYLPIILGYIFLLEIFGSHVYEALGFNALFFNLYNTVFYLFFYYVFYQVLNKQGYKRWVQISIGIFLLVTIVNLFYQNFITESQLIGYIVGACLLLLCIILYFIETLYSSRILVLKQELLFWISVGLLLFYVGYIPIKLTRLYFTDQQNSFMVLRIVHCLLTIIMNASFIIGLSWKWKMKK